jgi:UDP-N-acetylmuramoyl-tripeptide--D-alanyl-D-alanine ligase
MNILIALGIVAYLIRFAYRATSLLWLWFMKEYRLDRMRIHLTTHQGRALIFSKVTLLLLAALVVYATTPFTSEVLAFLSAVFLVLGVRHLRRGAANWFVPPRSPKVFALALAFLGFAASLFLLGYPALVTLAAVDILLFPVSAAIVFLFAIPTRAYHALVIREATQTLRKAKGLTVVGVTGSFGKTSVKDYLAAILSAQYKTIKTQASKNSAIAIAEIVKSELASDHKIFVVEMGAYKKGEIAGMSAIVRPEIGIVTAVNAQHQDLFGTLENTTQAKYELVAGLTGRKIAILNADDPRIRAMGAWAKRDGCHVWWYTKQNAETPSGDPVFRAQDIAWDLHGVRFTCSYKDTLVPVAAPVVGAHQVGNILAAVAAAVACGMEMASAAKGAAHIVPAKKVLEITSGVNGSTFIVDTFNNNPEGAKAALDVLSRAHGRKMLVFQPMIELGAYAKERHADVGAHAGRVCDVVFLTNNNWYEDFFAGVRTTSRQTQVKLSSPEKSAEFIQANVKKGDAVLFKGKDSEHVLARLLRKA